MTVSNTPKYGSIVIEYHQTVNMNFWSVSFVRKIVKYHEKTVFDNK